MRKPQSKTLSKLPYPTGSHVNPTVHHPEHLRGRDYGGKCVPVPARVGRKLHRHVALLSSGPAREANETRRLTLRGLRVDLHGGKSVRARSPTKKIKKKNKKKGPLCAYRDVD